MGNLQELAQEYSQYYGASPSDVSERMEELRRRKVVQDVDTVSHHGLKDSAKVQDLLTEMLEAGASGASEALGASGA